MKRLFRKLFPKKPAYEPAGIIHYGEHHIMLGINHYSAYNQPDGSTGVWANGEHIGNYPKDESLWKIIDHAKDQERP